MDQSTVLDYADLSAERLEYWQKRAFREWAMRPGPMLTYLKMLLSDTRTFASAIDIGLQHLGWTRGRSGPGSGGGRLAHASPPSPPSSGGRT